MKPTISVLVAARKNSKYLAKFLMGYFARTADQRGTEILVMGSAEDTWNEELRWFFEEHGVRFFTEDRKLGRAGLHIYLNELLGYARGDWIVYFCEDHFITMPDWDLYIRTEIRERGLNPLEPYCIIPKFDNAGAMNQILSRGYVEALGYVGGHGWIDSYLNDVNHAAFGVQNERPNYKPGDRIVRLDEEMFHDFTHDDPSPMSDAHLQSALGEEAGALPKFQSTEYYQMVEADAQKLKEAIEKL